MEYSDGPQKRVEQILRIAAREDAPEDRRRELQRRSYNLKLFAQCLPAGIGARR